MAVITIVGSGMMGSALAFPARENGHEVRLVGTHLDREIIEAARTRVSRRASPIIRLKPWRRPWRELSLLSAG